MIPLTRLFDGTLNVPITLAGSTGTTTLNRVACNITHNVGGFVSVALNANMNSNVIVGNRVICNDSNFTNRLNRIVIIPNRTNHPYNYNEENYLRACYSTANITHATHRFLRADSRPSLLHRVGPRSVASCSIDITTNGNSTLTGHVCSFANGVLNRTYTGFTTFSTPRTFMFFNNLAGTNSLLVRPLGGTCSRGMLGVCGNGTGFLMSALSNDSTTILNTDTIN